MVCLQVNAEYGVFELLAGGEQNSIYYILLTNKYLING